jgi:hypothetical protein
MMPAVSGVGEFLLGGAGLPVRPEKTDDLPAKAWRLRAPRGGDLAVAFAEPVHGDDRIRHCRSRPLPAVRGFIAGRWGPRRGATGLWGLGLRGLERVR